MNERVDRLHCSFDRRHVTEQQSLLNSLQFLNDMRAIFLVNFILVGFIWWRYLLREYALLALILLFYFLNF